MLPLSRRPSPPLLHRGPSAVTGGAQDARGRGTTPQDTALAVRKPSGYVRVWLELSQGWNYAGFIIAQATFTKLEDGVTKLEHGVTKLEDGVTKLEDGVTKQCHQA